MMVFKEKKFLVTGGAGFIGSEVVQQLLNKGSIVTVLDNFSSGKKTYLPKSKELKIIKGDIQDETIVSKAVKDQEIVIHLAALPFIPDSYYYPADFFKINTVGSVNLISSSVKSKSVERFVQISTSEVYGTAQYTPMDEQHPTSPHSTYAVSKLAADRAAFTLHKENGFPTVIVRPFNSYGPNYTEPYIIPEVMNQIISGSKELHLGNVNTSRDFTFVSDTANGMIKASMAKNAEGEILNVGSGSEIKILDLVHKIAKISKKNVKITYDENRERPFDVNRLLCNNKKAKHLLKWTPKISMDKGLKITFDWAQKNKVTFSSHFNRWYYKKT